MKHRFPISLAVMLLCIAVPFSAFADGRGKGVGSSIEWSAPAAAYDSATLTVSFPNGETLTKEYGAGRAIALRVSDLGTEIGDGAYNYQVTFTPHLSADTKKKLAAARAANDDAAARKAMRESGITPTIYSGTFTVSNGGIVDTEAVESGSGVKSDGEAGFIRDDQGGLVDTTTTTKAPSGKIAVNDQVIADDLIVQGSACVGLDCVNNESFGFDTIRLKENNTRIKFEDTSSSAGFSTNDWQLTANDSASGGASKFSIEDITGAKVPFTVTGGASTNSIFVDSTGRVGFRTSTPVLDLHVATSNTPAIRLEQNNSGGFTAQTWDIGANEANFFVRDVTGGSRLSFRIRPGAPTSSIDISADGDVGVGTASPNAKLDVQANETGVAAQRLQNSNSGGFSGTEYLDNGGVVDLFVGVVNSNSTARINSLNSQPLVVMANTVEKLRVATTGVTVTGDFTVTGGTKNFAMADPADPKNKAIYYAALEGPEAGTYYRGTSKTVNGEVVIELPGYFSRITENERMTVQLTPIGAPGQLYIASRSPEKLVIKVAEGTSDLEFDYLVQGIRKGYLDFQAERANNGTIQK